MEPNQDANITHRNTSSQCALLHELCCGSFSIRTHFVWHTRFYMLSTVMTTDICLETKAWRFDFAVTQEGGMRKNRENDQSNRKLDEFSTFQCKEERDETTKAEKERRTNRDKN